MIAAIAFALASTTFADRTAMPRRAAYDRRDCGGANRSPELHWHGAPAGTRSFALVMHDPDAPHRGGWDHWIVYNLPPNRTALAEGAGTPFATDGRNSFGQTGYGGPCPPPGPAHHYVFDLYALDVARISRGALTRDGLERAMRGHIVGRAEFVGLFRR